MVFSPAAAAAAAAALPKLDPSIFCIVTQVSISRDEECLE